MSEILYESMQGDNELTFYDDGTLDVCKCDYESSWTNDMDLDKIETKRLYMAMSLYYAEVGI